MTPAGVVPSTAAPAAAPLSIAPGTLEAAKWLALLLMTGDHVGRWLLHDSVPALYAAGRLAMPLFAFVLAYHAAQPGFFSGGAARRTSIRLAAFGLLAWVPLYALGKELWGWWPLNVMFLFLAGLWIVAGLAGRSALGFIGAGVLFAGAGVVVEYWWPGLLVFMAAWNYARRANAWNLALLAAALFVLWPVNKNLWALCALPLFMLAPRVSIAVPRLRWVFYAFYPAHLALIAVAERMLTTPAAVALQGLV